MERSMIIIGGGLRTGRTTLARNIAENLNHEYDTRYISFGETVRAIGRHALHQPLPNDEYIDSYYSHAIKDHLQGRHSAELLDDDVAWGVMNEALTRTDSADLVLVDGYPKNKTQADDLISLATGDDRRIAGLLIATVDEEEALTRMLMRGRDKIAPPYDEKTALERLRSHSQAFGQAVLHLASTGIPIESVDTAGTKDNSTQLGLKYVKSFLE